MKTLLLGAGGQLGRELAALWPEAIAPGRDEADLASPAALQAVLRQVRPELIVNAAAYTAVDRAESEPEQAFAVNAEALEVLAGSGAAVLHFSTDYVFDGRAREPYSVEHPAHPINTYGSSKWEGEQILRRAQARHWIVRTSWVFGTHGHNFVKTMLRLAREREELRVVSDQQGCPTSARSLARAAGELVRLDQSWGTYHFTNGPATDWYRFARAIVTMAAELGHPVAARRVVPIATQDYPTPAARPGYSVLDCSKIELLLGRPCPDWREELRQVLAELPRSSPAGR